MKPLHWIAAASLLAVFIAPPTRRAALEQARLVLGITPPEAYLFPSSSFRPNPPSLTRRQAEDYRRVAARHPEDIGLQMAAPVAPLEFSFTEFNKAFVAGIRPVLATHPNSPAIYAFLLQYGSQCLGDVGDEYKAASPKWQPLRDAIDPRPAHPLPRVTFADYDAWAVAGERLDPDNAFFPALRSAGLFKMGRKREALASLDRAASARRWDDYGGGLLQGVCALPREAYGRTDPMVSASVTTFPMCSGMRGVARNAVEEAQALERAGNAEAGLRIRRSLWRMAGVWRAQSRDLIGAMTASAIGSMAAGELGGHVRIDPKWPGDKKRQVRRDSVLAYLRRSGHGADADWLLADFAKRDAMLGIIREGLGHSGVFTMPKAMGSWAAALILFNAALWLGLLAAMVFWVRGATAGRGRRVLAAVAVAAALLVLQGRAQEGWLAQQAPLGVGPFFLGWLSAAVGALAVPAFLAVLLGLTALIRRKPFRKSVGAWLRASLVPAACVLAVLFVAVSIWGVKPQREWREYTNAQVTGEGRYYAHLVGKPWSE